MLFMLCRVTYVTYVTNINKLLPPGLNTGPPICQTWKFENPGVFRLIWQSVLYTGCITYTGNFEIRATPPPSSIAWTKI